MIQKLLVLSLAFCLFAAVNPSNTQGVEDPAELPTTIQVEPKYTGDKPLNAIAVFGELIASQSYGQEFSKLIPKDSIAVIHLANSKSIGTVLDFSFEQLGSNEVLDLMCSPPFPLMEREKFESTLSKIRQELTEKIQFDSLTIYLMSISPKIEYCIVLKFADARRPDLSNVDILGYGDNEPNKREIADTEVDALDLDKAEEAEAVPDYDMSRLASKLLADLRPTTIGKWESGLVLSNCPAGTWTLERLTAERNADIKSSLFGNRRFRRAIGALKGNSNQNSAILYCVPTETLPFVSEKYNEDYLSRFGISNLVGASLNLSIDDELPPKIRFSIAIPYTLPRSGLAKHWESLVPIDTVPNFSIFKQSLEYLVVTNRDRKAYLRDLRETFQEDSQGYEKNLGLGRYRFGTLGEREGFYTGKSTYAIVAEPDFERRFVTAYSFEDDVLTRSYVESNVKVENKKSSFLIEKTEVDGHEYWYLNEEDARSQSVFNGDLDDDSDQEADVVSYGLAIIDKLLYVGCKRLAVKMKDETEIPLSKLLEKLGVADGTIRFLTDSSPSWLKYRSVLFLAKATSSTRRSHYLDTKYGKRKGGELMAKYEFGNPIEIESTSDRIFAVTEALITNSLDGYQSSIWTFSDSKQSAKYYFALEPKPR